MGNTKSTSKRVGGWLLAVYVAARRLESGRSGVMCTSWEAGIMTRRPWRGQGGRKSDAGGCGRVGNEIEMRVCGCSAPIRVNWTSGRSDCRVAYTPMASSRSSSPQSPTHAGIHAYIHQRPCERTRHTQPKKPIQVPLAPGMKHGQMAGEHVLPHEDSGIQVCVCVGQDDRMWRGGCWLVG